MAAGKGQKPTAQDNRSPGGNIIFEKNRKIKRYENLEGLALSEKLEKFGKYERSGNRKGLTL